MYIHNGAHGIHYAKMIEMKPLKTDRLPLNCDVFGHYRYLLSSGMARSSALRLTAKNVCEIWNRAECPCLSTEVVFTRITKLYHDWQKQSFRSGKHVRSNPRPLLQPTRKSSRFKPALETKSLALSSRETIEKMKQEDIGDLLSRTSNMATETKMQKDLGESKGKNFSEIAKKLWLQTLGQELLDILNFERIYTRFEYFDKDFYDDQKGPRLRRIEEPTVKKQELKESYKAISEALTQLRIKNASPLSIPSFQEMIECYDDTADSDEIGGEIFDEVESTATLR